MTVLPLQDKVSGEKIPENMILEDKISEDKTSEDEIAEDEISALTSFGVEVQITHRPSTSLPVPILSPWRVYIKLPG